MSKRKIALLAGCAVLLCVYIIQIVSSNKTALKTISFDAEPDTIELVRPSEKITLTKNGDAWQFTVDGAAEKFDAVQYYAISIVNALKKIELAGTVAKNTDELSRYGLAENQAITATAYADGKKLRTLKLGKTSSTGYQTYVMVDGGTSVFLMSGALASTFNVEIENLKQQEEEPPAEDAEMTGEVELLGEEN